MLSRASLTILLMLVFSAPAHADRASSDWKPVRAEDLRVTAESIGQPSADAAILLREGVLTDEGETGTALMMYVRVKIFTDNGRRYADVQLPYRADLGKISDVHARTIRPDGSVVVVEGRDIFDKLLLTTAHSAWRAKTFSFPSVVPGSIIEYRYRQNYPAGFRYFELDLQSDLFIRELVYRIQPDKASAFDLRWITFNAQDPSRFAPKWNGSYNIEAADIAPFLREPLMPPERAVKMWGWLYYSKDTETDPDKYWRRYGRDEYDKEIAETRPTRLIRQVLEALIVPQDSLDRKISRIYSYLQSQIHNVTSSDIQAWRLDRNKTPDDTIRRRYGTSRDMNRLFITMLRAAGVDARAAELTTRDENFFHFSFADAIQFDSEITAIVRSDGKIEFYDPGTRFCPPGILAWEKEGVQTLVLDKDEPKFMETPVTPASQNRVDRDLRVTVLPDGNLRVNAVQTFSGHRAIDLRTALGARSGDSLRAGLLQVLEQMVPGGTIDANSFSVKGLEDHSGPITLSYAFVAAPFAPPTQTRMLLRPGLLGRKAESLFQAAHRANPVYFQYPWSETDRVAISVPSGYTLEQAAEDASIDDDALKYTLTHTVGGDSIVYERRMEISGFFFSPSEYTILRSFLDLALQNDRAVITLRR